MKAECVESQTKQGHGRRDWTAPQKRTKTNIKSKKTNGGMGSIGVKHERGQGKGG